MDQLASSLAAQCAAGSHAEAAEAARKAAPQLAKASMASLESGMSSLSLPAHSVAVAALLGAKVAHLTNANKDGLLLQTQAHLEVVEFSESVDVEVVRTHAADLFGNLYSRLAEQLLKTKSPGDGIPAVRTGLRRLQTRPGELTSLHADLCLLALSARTLGPALEILEEDIEAVGDWGKGRAFPAKPFLLYFYYGGLAYAALRRYDRAQHFFELAVTVPATAVSAIMVEAYKAHVLVSLILEGKPAGLPKYTSPVVQRFIKPNAQHYHELANAYAQGDPAQVETLMTKHWGVGTSPLTGLVRRVLDSLYKRNIARLTRTFLTLSLADVAQRAKLPGGPADAERYLKEMMSTGEIHARIEAGEAMVHFQDDPNRHSSPADVARLEAQLDEATRLAALVHRLDNEVLTTATYVQRMGKGRGGGGVGGGGMAEGLGLGFHDDEGVSVAVPPAVPDLMAPFAPHF